MFGGRLGPDGETEKPLNDMWKFKVTEGEDLTAKWEQIEQKGEIPCARSFH